MKFMRFARWGGLSAGALLLPALTALAPAAHAATTGVLTSVTSPADATAAHPPVGTKIVTTVEGDRVDRTYEKTGVLAVVVGPHVLRGGALASLGLRSSAATPDTDQHCGYGSLTYTCLYVQGSGLYVDYMNGWGVNLTSETLNMDEKLYAPPPSAFNLIASTGYTWVPPGDTLGLVWAPYSDVAEGTYTSTTWIGGLGVDSEAQVGVVP